MRLKNRLNLSKLMRLIINILLILVVHLSLSAQGVTDDYFNAVAKMKYGECDNALLYLKKAIAVDRSNAKLYLKQAECLFQLERYDEAIDQYKFADSLNDGCASYDIARCYTRLGDESKAVNSLKKHLNSSYKYSITKIKTDKTFNRLSESGYWQQMWRNDWYDKYENQLIDAEYTYQSKEYYDALYLLNRLIDAKPRYNKALVLRAKVNVALNDTKSAIDDLTMVIGIQKDSEYLQLRADIYFQEGKYTKALGDYNEALELNPLSLKLYYERALVNYKLKDYNAAQKDIKRYITYLDKDAEGNYLAGLISLESDASLDALLYLGKALELSQSESKYFVARGDAYAKTNTYQYADYDYSQALDINPRLSEVYLKRGVVRLEAGKKEAACSDWNRARKLGNLNATEYIRRYCQD